MAIDEDAIAKATQYVEKRFRIKLPTSVLRAATAEAEQIISSLERQNKNGNDSHMRTLLLRTKEKFKLAAENVGRKVGAHVCQNIVSQSKSKGTV